MKREQLEFTLTDAEADDAKALLAFYREVGAETDFLTFGANGLGIKASVEAAHLANIYGSWNNRILIARVDDEIVGVVTVAAPVNQKDSHVGELGIVLRQKYWGVGISRVLMSDMLDWATESPILRYLVLGVDSENIRAQKFYAHFDFTEIGRVPGGLKHANDYHDVIWYGRSVTDNAGTAR